MTERAAGWLPDPFDPQGSIRYWDGTRWTDDTRPTPTPTAAPAPPATEPPMPTQAVPSPKPPMPAQAVPTPGPEVEVGSGNYSRLLLVVILIALLGGAGWLFLGGDDAETSSTAVATTSSTTVDTTTTEAPTTTEATTTTTSTTTTTTTTAPLIPLLDTVGLSMGEASAALEAAGLVVTVVEVEVEDMEPGTVIATNPAAGTELLAGASVEIQVAVAAPPQCNDVPDPLPVAGFGDIGALDSEGTTAAHWAAAVGLINDSAQLNPRDPMSRAALTTVLWRYFCEPPPASSAGYPDVDSTAFYAAAADWAADSGYVTGTAEGTFDPDAPITRAQFVTIAWRSVGEPVPTGPAPFTDAVAGAFYSAALDWAFSEGLVGGTSANTFDPDGPLDRITSIILFYRLELNVDPEVMP